MKNRIPLIKKGDERNKFLFREEDKKLIIQGTHVLFILEDVEKDIYDLINGENKVDDIIEKIALQYGESSDNIRQDVLAFLTDLGKNNIIEFKNESK